MLIWTGAVRVARRGPACGKLSRALVFRSRCRSRSMTMRRRARPASAIPAGPGQGPAGPRSAPCGRPFPAQTLREKTSQRPGPRPCPPGPADPGQHPRQDRPWRKRARVCKTGRAAKLPGPRGLLTQIPTASGASPSVSGKTRGSYQIVTSARPARQIHPPLRTCRRRRSSLGLERRYLSEFRWPARVRRIPWRRGGGLATRCGRRW